MKLVIDISDDDYRKVQDGRASVSMMRKTIRNGTALPKGHGRLIDENEIDTVVNGVFNDYKCSPKNFLNAIHSQCIEVVGADRTESEDKK